MRIFLKVICSSLVLLVFLFSFSVKAQPVANSIHFGVQFGSFYNDIQGAHTGSVPFTFGYDYYPLERYGFRVAGYFTKQNDFYSISDAVIYRDGLYNSYTSRNTNIIGVKFSNKFWIKDLIGTKNNFGIESGIGILQYRFKTDYVAGFSNRSSFNENKILTPLHTGISIKLFYIYEMSILYNFFPLLGWQKETFEMVGQNTPFQNPLIRRSYISTTFRVFIPWD